MTAAGLLDQIAGRLPVMAPLALVVAHPDDESIAAAGSLARFRALTLIHVTDGAPDSATALAALGYDSRAQYAAIRRAELDAALAAAAAAPLRRLCYEIADQAVADDMAGLAARLRADLLPVAAVITHPYENGHTDHDACAQAVQLACASLRELTGRCPARLEFASYFRIGGDLRTCEFQPGSGDAARYVDLSAGAIRRKEAAFASFTSQRDNLRYFSSEREAFRIAPLYNFAESLD